MFEPLFPSVFKISQPLPVLERVGYIDDNFDKVIAIENAAMSPVPLNLLGLITRSSKIPDDFENSFSKSLRRYVPAIIELEG